MPVPRVTGGPVLPLPWAWPVAGGVSSCHSVGTSATTSTGRTELAAEMSHPEQSLDLPEFESIDLDVPIDDAHRAIDDAIAGLYASETEEGLKFRTADGMLVAVLAKRPSGSGDTMSCLAYRTEPASESATRKARKVHEALAPHEISA